MQFITLFLWRDLLLLLLLMNMKPSVTQRVCIAETYIKEKSYKKGNRIFKGRFLCLSAPFAINVPDNLLLWK